LKWVGFQMYELPAGGTDPLVFVTNWKEFGELCWVGKGQGQVKQITKANDIMFMDEISHM